MSRRNDAHVDQEGDRWLNANKWAAMALWDWLTRWTGEETMDGVRVMSIRVTVPQGAGEKYKAVVKGRAADGTPVVCFGGGDTYQSAMAELMARAQAQNIRWREDQPWDPSKGGAQ